MTKYIFYLNVAFLAVACSRYPSDVEHSLKLAGENRAELEKVLAYYSQRPEDSLKLQSAYFLIANMPYHYTIHDAKLDSFKTHLKKEELHKDFLADYVKKIGSISGKTEIKPDLYHITSEYLIRNIDLSFQVWQETPWGKYISFDDFCEDILPYRLSHEPLEYWKEEYYAVLRPILDTITHNNNPEIACMTLLSHIHKHKWTFEQDLQTQGFGASIILQKRYGNCKEQAEFITYVLRSVGIPSGINMIVQNPDHRFRAHYWNYIRNLAGKNISFNYFEYRTFMRKFGKIYRQCYALQKGSLPVKYKNKYIPLSQLRNPLLRDVSFEYFPDTHISVHAEPTNLFGKDDLAYLCTFNGDEWVPITGSKPKNGIALFQNIEPNLLYQVRLIDETRNLAASKPFIYRNNENTTFLDADTNNLQSMKLLRKYKIPEIQPYYAARAINGKFQGANQPDFSDSVTLHIIQEDSHLSYFNIKPEYPGKFRYVRYLSANGGYNNMAEVQFYSGGKRLHGKVTGTDGARDEFPNSAKYSVFDNDPLTFFDALEADGAWAGLELDKAYHIDVIIYIFRNDDNNIRTGDTYELLYHSNGQWLSAGKQTADTTILYYGKVPSNTLYWLRNHTRGKEERPFTYEKDKQVWW